MAMNFDGSRDGLDLDILNLQSRVMEGTPCIDAGNISSASVPLESLATSDFNPTYIHSNWTGFDELPHPDSAFINYLLDDTLAELEHGYMSALSDQLSLGFLIQQHDSSGPPVQHTFDEESQATVDWSLLSHGHSAASSFSDLSVDETGLGLIQPSDKTPRLTPGLATCGFTPEAVQPTTPLSSNHQIPLSKTSMTRFSRETIRVLNDWLARHADYPYPNESQCNRLMKSTGLTNGQLVNWFANARRRGKARHSNERLSMPKRVQIQQYPASSVAPRPPTPAVDIPRRAPAPLEHFQDMSPLERWKMSPPEHEPASVNDIAKALSTAPPHIDTIEQPPNSSPLSNRNSSSSRGSFNVFHTPSMTSLDTSNSGSFTGSAMSAFSDQSLHRHYDSSIKRRRRRKLAIRPRVADNLRVIAPELYQCTFCTESFKTKYDWARHEKALHLVLESWTCAPFGGIVRSEDGAGHCTYCDQMSPSENHLAAHRHSACVSRPMAERSFFRKDHLRQHLRLVHDCSFISSMEGWKTKAPEYLRSRCGFCDAGLSTWTGRVEHLARHFRDGISMEDWKGDWGFEADVLRRVESAIPPYMIHHDRLTVNPFIAPPPPPGRKEDDAERLPYQQYSFPDIEGLGWFQGLEQALATYVEQAQAWGVTPSDADLQYYARQAVYGTDDQWNTTAADRQEWLDRFKRTYGLSDSEGPELERTTGF